jgi:hypothetical protein
MKLFVQAVLQVAEAYVQDPIFRTRRKLAEK